MSLSPAPVLDFFFDCGPPPQKPQIGSNTLNYERDYSLIDHSQHHSHLLSSHQHGGNSVDFFDVQFSNCNRNIEKKKPPQAPVHNEHNYSCSPPSNQIVEHLEEFKYTGLTLNSPWTLWINRFVPNLSKEQFESNLRKIYTMSTVKTFWNVFNHMPLPNVVKPQYSYHLMRDNIRPVWEDASHAYGGMWKLRCPKRFTNTVWQELLLACVGEQFLDDINPDDEILGLSVSIRKNDDLVQVWNMNSAMAGDSNVIRKIKQLCPDVQFETSFYKPHHSYWQQPGRST